MHHTHLLGLEGRVDSDPKSGARFRDELPEPVGAAFVSGFLVSGSARMRRRHSLRRILDLDLEGLGHLTAIDSHVDLIPVEK